MEGALSRSKAGHVFRMYMSQGMFIAVCVTLVISSVVGHEIPVALFLAIIMACVGVIGVATGQSQIAVFSCAVRMGKPAYSQAVVLGQALSGILPPVARKSYSCCLQTRI